MKQVCFISDRFGMRYAIFISQVVNRFYRKEGIDIMNTFKDFLNAIELLGGMIIVAIMAVMSVPGNGLLP